jgi:hypothetical protein
VVSAAGLAASCIAAVAAFAAPHARVAALYNLKSFPRASFTWFPAVPRTGERFLLVSTSKDMTSPIVSYAWDVADDGPFGPFRAAGASTQAAFPTPADHVVRLRVTAADGLSSIVAETIQMSVPPPGVLAPFPDVRISGRVLRGGVRISTLAVKAPVGALIRVSCIGRACPLRSARLTATSPNGHPVAVTRFHSFQRFLPSGATLQIRVTKESEIGAYTRFSVRRHKLPLRVDSCLGPTGLNPVACPTT